MLPLPIVLLLLTAPVRELLPQTGHSAGISSVRYTADGKFLFSGASDKTVRVWTSDGKQVLKIQAPEGIRSVVLSHDQTMFVVGNTVYKMDGTVVQKNLAGNWFSAFSRDDKHLLVAKVHGVKVWDIASGKAGREMNTPDQTIQNAVVDPKTGTIILGTDKTVLSIWNPDYTFLREATGHRGVMGGPGQIMGLAFDVKNRRLLSVADDGQLIIWDPATWKPIKQIAAHPWAVSVAVSPDGETIITSGSSEAITATTNIGNMKYEMKIWSKDGALLKTVSGFKSSAAVAFAPDSSTFALGIGDETDLRMYTKSGVEIRRLTSQVPAPTRIGLHPNGNTFAVATEYGGVHIWSMDGRMLMTLEHPGKVLSVTYSGDGSRLLSVSKEGARIWAESGALLSSFDLSKFDKTKESWKDAPGDITAGTFSTDGTQVILGINKKSYLDGKVNGEVFSFDPSGGNKRKVYARDYIEDPIQDLLTVPGTDTILVRDARWLVHVKLDGTVLTKADKAFNHGYREHMPANEDLFVRSTGDYSEELEVVKYAPTGFTVVHKVPRGTVKRWSEPYAVSAKQGLIAAGGEEGKLQLLSFDGKPARELALNANDVTSLTFSLDGKYLLSTSNDGTIGMTYVATGASLTLIGAKNGQWIALTRDGLFDSSPQGGALVNVREGRETYGVDQFAFKNNRPDLMLESIGWTDAAAIKLFRAQYERRLRRAGLKEADVISEVAVPTAIIGETKVEGKFATLALSLSDPAVPLATYNIFVNDVPMYGRGKTISGASTTVSDRVELSTGRNKIEVVVTNQKGVESYRPLTYATYDGITKGALYYIGFGVSKYKDKKLELKYAAKDALDLGKVFSGMTDSFSAVHVKTFTDAEVTPQNVKKAKELLNDAKVDDTFVLFIAGHGVHDSDAEATYYYLPHGANVAKVAKTSIDFSDIEALLHDIAPRSKLFLMDTCESGEADGAFETSTLAMAGSRGIRARTTRGLKVSKKGTPPPRPALSQRDRFIYSDLMRRSGAIVFSSSRGGEYSYETDTIANGFFTEELMTALTQKVADQNGDGQISTDELRAYVASAVAKVSSDMQHPTVDRDNLSQRFAFPIAAPAP